MRVRSVQRLEVTAAVLAVGVAVIVGVEVGGLRSLEKEGPTQVERGSLRATVGQK